MAVLKNPADKTLEVVSFSASQENRVIRGGSPLLEDLNVPLDLLRNPEEDVEEVFARHVSRTTACHQIAAWVQHVDGETIQVVICAKCFGQSTFSRSEFGWINNDHVKAFALFSQ